ncbi:unnamed protein product [Rotaria magnacalcarata]|uniref:Carbohydrate sulfotransferase n=1 Tax=Rotaria magnacalcarata TaxID=392030 RepID=A0A816KHS5_9BILA|nr:unnamed protein product [Rotaria magnacalcarata]
MFRYRQFIHLLGLILISYLVYFPIFHSSLKQNEVKSKSIDYCLKKNVKSNEKFYSNLVYIPRLNILYCNIPKVASTNLRRLIYIYLNQSNSLLNLDRKKIWIDHKNFFNQYYLTENSQILFKNKNLFKFILVRHPFRRIYSVYYDKFVNNHIDDTLFGWKQLEEDILLQMKRNETLLTIRRHDIRLDFRTFLLYIIDSIRKKRLINSHWEQIVQRCALCLIGYDWIGKIENFDQDGKFLMKKLNDKSDKIYLEFPSKELDKQERRQNLLNDSDLFEFFRKTIQNNNEFEILVDYYKPDFEISHQNLSSKMTEGTAAQVSSVQTANNTNASPKKAKKTTSTKGKSTHTATHPKYSEMIKAALKALNDRGGSSRAAILKFVLANYSLDPAQANQHLKLALKNGVKAKYFKQTKGNGASGSFKLAAKTETKPAKKATKPKKTTKSTTSAAASATKKRARSKSAGTKPAKKVATAADSTNTTAAATTPVKPKKVKVVKSRSSATAKSDNAAKVAKPKQTKAKKPTGTKTAGVKKATTKKVVKPKVKKATTPKKPKSPAAKKPAAAKKAAKPKTAAKKASSPKKAK